MLTSLLLSLFLCSNQYNKLGLNQRQTFIGQMRRIWNKASDLVTHALEPTPIKELGKHRVIDMAIGPTHSCLVVETGKVNSLFLISPDAYSELHGVFYSGVHVWS